MLPGWQESTACRWLCHSAAPVGTTPLVTVTAFAESLMIQMNGPPGPMATVGSTMTLPLTLEMTRTTGELAIGAATWFVCPAWPKS